MQEVLWPLLSIPYSKMEKIDYSKSIQSVFVICIALLVLSINTNSTTPVYLCLLIGISGLVSKYITDKIHWAWMKFAWVLSLVFPPIIMGVLFYLFLTPIAKLSSLFSKKDNLQLKRPQGSTFIDREKDFEKADFLKTW